MSDAPRVFTSSVQGTADQAHHYAACAIIEPGSTADVVRAAESLHATLDGNVKLAVVFSSAHLSEATDEIAAGVQTVLAPDAMIGTCAQGVIANDSELEDAASVAIWATSAVSLNAEAAQVGFVEHDGAEFLGLPGLQEASGLILVADPRTFPVDAFVDSLRTTSPGLPVVGGLASAARHDGNAALILDGETRTSGAVVAALSGRTRMTTIVSQGCRPVGEPFIVTSAERNVVHELGGRPAAQRLRELFESLTEDDRNLATHGLQVGRVIDETRDRFERGDFLIRSLMAIDRRSGSIAIGDLVEVGATLQFHVRDATTADEDLQGLLAHPPAELLGTPQGALLFTCNGRGRNLFGAPDHDAGSFQKQFPGLPLAGFFCAGEIGPVGSENFVHGFTASACLFSDPD